MPKPPIRQSPQPGLSGAQGALNAPPLLLRAETDPEFAFHCANCGGERCGGKAKLLTTEEHQALSKIARLKRLSAGQTYVMEGDKLQDFAGITAGIAKMVRDAPDGRSQIVGLLFPTDFVGGLAPQGIPPRQLYTIVAVTDLSLWLFPRAAFDRLRDSHGALEHRLLCQAIDDLQTAREWMVLLGRKTALERVASFMLYVNSKSQKPDGASDWDFELPLSRVDIADFIGLTFETVSRQITKLRQSGVIEISNSKYVTVTDPDQLRRLAGF